MAVKMTTRLTKVVSIARILGKYFVHLHQIIEPFEASSFLLEVSNGTWQVPNIAQKNLRLLETIGNGRSSFFVIFVRTWK